jgi:flagellar motor switch protein FliN/FliY
VTETLAATTALDVAAAVAAAALGALPMNEPLTAGQPTRDPAGAVLDGQAVVARFSGSTSGEVMILVGRALVDALENSPLGSLDVSHALRPALEAAVAAIGPVVLGPAQALSAQAAVDALLVKPDSALVLLSYYGEVRSVIGVSITANNSAGGAGGAGAAGLGAGLDATAGGAATAGAFAQGGSNGAPSAAGLDLLRSVEMDVTAELGRARMTLNELLTLTDGAVIELDRAAGAPADLLVNGRLIARGEVVVIDENFGLRITEIVADATAR